MNRSQSTPPYETYLRRRPDAWAILKSSTPYPQISGNVRFYEVPYGVLVVAEVHGLPFCDGESSFFGFHIHEGSSCTGDVGDPLRRVGMHYNPRQASHPSHAGDLPPLLGAGGNAFSVFLTDRFRIDETIGRTVIIHSSPDDFTTQPAGGAGTKIACGEIVGARRHQTP